MEALHSCDIKLAEAAFEDKNAVNAACSHRLNIRLNTTLFSPLYVGQMI
jgi:hypothetical protein